MDSHWLCTDPEPPTPLGLMKMASDVSLHARPACYRGIYIDSPAELGKRIPRPVTPCMFDPYIPIHTETSSATKFGQVERCPSDAPCISPVGAGPVFQPMASCCEISIF